MQNYFSKSAKETLNDFKVTKEGLSDNQFKSNLETYGHNELNEKKKATVLQVFLSQFKDLLVFILIAAAIISMATGNVESTFVIFAVIILNAIFRYCSTF